MKLPFEIERLIDLREDAANRLFEACAEVDEWLRQHDFDIYGDDDLYDLAGFSTLVVCEPETAANGLREYLEQHLEETEDVN